MKRIMMTMAVAAMSMTAMMAQSHEVTTTDKNGNKVVYEISDAAATKGDTLNITTYDPNSVAKSDSINGIDKSSDYVMTKEDLIDIIHETGINSWGPTASTAIAGIVFGGFLCVVLPIVIIALVLYYRHRNRERKYELAQKIVDSGQPLPEDFSKMFEDEVREDKAGLFEKGVKNIGIGIALSLFLWFMTDELWMGCIGLFVLASGVSQLLTYYKYKPQNKPENSTDTNKSIFDNIQKD